MANPHIELGVMLKKELEERIVKNSRYSLRCFARDLNLSPSFLSKLMRGRRNFTPKVLAKIAESIRISDPEYQRLDAEIREYKMNVLGKHSSTENRTNENFLLLMNDHELEELRSKVHQVIDRYKSQNESMDQDLKRRFIVHWDVIEFINIKENNPAS